MNTDIKKRAKTLALIAAAGTGIRMQSECNLNKLAIPVRGKPILCYTVEVFQKCDFIDSILIIGTKAERIITDRQKIIGIVAGGTSRQQSVYKGLQFLFGQELNENLDKYDIITVHDGARPAVTKELILTTIEAAILYGSGCCAVKVKDTIKSSSNGEFFDRTLDRKILWSIQTPQCFQTEILLNAHNRAAKVGYEGTDDAYLAEKAGNRVKIVAGDYSNIKITTKYDLKSFKQGIK